MTVFQSDFDGRVDVLPVSDPNIPSRAHRLSLASLALQMSAQTPPGTFNTPELIRQVLEAADFPNIDQVLPKPQEAVPADPVTDIMNASKGMPIKAFPGQNHQAHIAVKTAFLQDPNLGGSPAIKPYAGILQANITEHTMLGYQEAMQGLIAQQTGMPPEQVSAMAQQGALDQVMVAAAQQIAAASQNAQPGTPEEQLLEIDRQRLALEQEKLKINAVQNATELATRNRQLDLQEDKQRVAAMKDGIKILSDKEEKEKDREERRRENLLDLLADAIKSGNIQ